MRTALRTILLNPAPKTLHLTATTTGAGQTVTLQQITPAAGKTLTIDWGDASSTVVAAGDEAEQAHVYASAASYGIAVRDIRRMRTLDLRDSKIGGLQTRELRGCTLDTFYVSGISATGSYFNSADFAGAGLSSTFYLYNVPLLAGTFNSSDFASAGLSNTFYLNNVPLLTGTFNSSDFASAGLSNTFYLNNVPLLTGTFNSSDFASAGLSSTFYLYNVPLLTGTFNSADFASAGLSNQFYLSSVPLLTGVFNSSDFAGAGLANRFYLNSVPLLTWTIAANDIDNWIGVDEIRLNDAGLDAAALSQLILGCYQMRAAMTHDTPVLNVGGASNAVPGGVYQDAVTPTTDLEYIYKLVNDPDAEGFYRWTVVWNGGSAP